MGKKREVLITWFGKSSNAKDLLKLMVCVLTKDAVVVICVLSCEGQRGE